jgi:DNA-binding CsgD family transcriptional regulator
MEPEGASDRETGPLRAQDAAGAGSGVQAILLEREAEVARLAAAIAEAAAGDGRMVLVEGAPGIGKTRLLAEARRLAEPAGFRVLTARGGELEREFAFGVVRQLFDHAVARHGANVLTGAAATAGAVFAADGAVEGAEPTFASLHGLYWLTANLAAERPLMVAVDDLHWCDGPSLRFLAYLVRRLEGLAVLVVGTVRSAEPRDLPPLQEIICDPVTVSIRPAPLSVPATAALVAERLGEEPDEVFVTTCHTVTGGNPLLLVELLRTLSEEGVSPDAAHVSALTDLGPRVASRAGLVRLGRLSPEAVRVAQAVAVLGDDAELSTVASLADTTVERAGGAVAELVCSELLGAEVPLGFVHPLVAAAVHDDMAAVDRALAHERAARLLADGGAAAERVGAHLLLSPTRSAEWVVKELTKAAGVALRRGAPDSAVAYLERAVREPPPIADRAKVLLALGRAEALTRGPAAVEHLTQAYELLEDPTARAVAARSLSRTLLLTGQAEDAARLAREAAARLPPALADERRQLEALELAALVIGHGAGAAEARLAEYRRGPVGTLGEKMLAAVAIHEWVSSGGDSGQCAAVALEALAGGELIAADNGLLAVMAISVLGLADRPEALDAWELSLAQAHRHGSLFDLKSVTLWRGFTLYWRGELADAEDSIRSHYEGRLWGMGGLGYQYADAVLAAVRRERGDLDGARRVLEQSRDGGDLSDPARYWLYSQLEQLVAEGRMLEALAVAEDFQRRFAPLGEPVDTPWRSPTALALHRLGRDAEAVALAAEDLEVARRWGAPGTVARALRTLAALDGDPGFERLREAVELTAATPARLQHAKALAALGASLRRARRPTDAREPLRRALELAEVLGADGLLKDVRAELYASGARPRSTALRGVAALTPSERRVAAMAAGGLTNREIAQQLFVTPKTVELHLGRAFRKLDVRSRRQLTAYSAELGGDAR